MTPLQAHLANLRLITEVLNDPKATREFEEWKRAYYARIKRKRDKVHGPDEVNGEKSPWRRRARLGYKRKKVS